MNLIVKSGIAGALALGATGAYALGLPSSNSSDLVLVVENQTTFATYALDTGISLSSIMPAGQLVTGANLSTAISIASDTIAPSATLQSFLAANPASGDAWALEGGQYAGAGNVSNNGNSKVAGKALAVFDSLNGTQFNNELQGKTLANLEFYENGINASVGPGGGINALTTATETTAAAYTQDTTNGGQASTKYSMIAVNDVAPLGSTALQLFGFTGNGTTGALQSYILGTASVSSNGTVTIAGNGGGGTAPVPLPAAVWLFGSGLMGLVGVSRRRKTVAAV